SNSQFDVASEIAAATELDPLKRSRDKQRLEAFSAASAETLSQQRARLRFSSRVGEGRSYVADEGSIGLANVDLHTDNALSLQAPPEQRESFFLADRHGCLTSDCIPEIYPEIGV